MPQPATLCDLLQLAMRFVLPGYSALLYLVAIAHAEITGFSGDTCNGDVGLNVPCDGGSCHMFDNRHSFRVCVLTRATAPFVSSVGTHDMPQVDAGVGNHCVTMFGEPGCSGGIMHTFVNQSAQCTHVNTGTNVRSFLCAPNNTCLV